MEIEIDIKDIRTLVEVVKKNYNFDLGEYALSSLKRRLQRILEVYKFPTMNELTYKVGNNKLFFEEFLREITVNTTEMFRDPSFWRKLRDEVFPLFQNTPTIRIWHAACSSGEEVYSMAIALKEAGLFDKAKIYASDINELVMAKAQVGKYPIRNMEINEPNYERYSGEKELLKYYSANGDFAQMDTSLLSNVTFKKFDLVAGEPFMKFDLILCRNVLIYFTLPLQDRVVEIFSRSLMTGGLLAVGSKETIAWCKSYAKYSSFSLEEKIFKKIKD